MPSIVMSPIRLPFSVSWPTDEGSIIAARRITMRPPIPSMTTPTISPVKLLRDHDRRRPRRSLLPRDGETCRAGQSYRSRAHGCLQARPLCRASSRPGHGSSNRTDALPKYRVGSGWDHPRRSVDPDHLSASIGRLCVALRPSAILRLTVTRDCRVQSLGYRPRHAETSMARSPFRRRLQLGRCRLRQSRGSLDPSRGPSSFIDHRHVDWTLSSPLRLAGYASS